MIPAPMRGFTLIELLMVIAIIGMLSSIILGSLNIARINARDSRRIQDIKQIENALALYASDNGGNYPPVTDTLQSYVDTIETALEPTYISVLPHDPTRTGASRYRYMTKTTTNFSSYTILLNMEGDPDIVRIDDGTPSPYCRIQMPGADTGQGYAPWETAYPICQ